MAWTEITRLKYQRDGLRYASDTVDAEWAVIDRGRARRTWGMSSIPFSTWLNRAANGICYPRISRRICGRKEDQGP